MMLQVLTVLNVIGAVVLLLVSYDAVKYIYITKKNKIFIWAYVLLALMLFSFVLNILALNNTLMPYIPNVYAIDKTILVLILVFVLMGMKKFTKAISVKGGAK